MKIRKYGRDEIKKHNAKVRFKNHWTKKTTQMVEESCAKAKIDPRHHPACIRAAMNHAFDEMYNVHEGKQRTTKKIIQDFIDTFTTGQMDPYTVKTF